MTTETKDIYLAGGCFWGTEHYFKQIEGVVETEVGFANGYTDPPTYKEVYTDTTGFAETVHVRYNPNVVSGFATQVSGQTNTPYGPVYASFNLKTGRHFLSVPEDDGDLQVLPDYVESASGGRQSHGL